MDIVIKSLDSLLLLAASHLSRSFSALCFTGEIVKENNLGHILENPYHCFSPLKETERLLYAWFSTIRGFIYMLILLLTSNEMLTADACILGRIEIFPIYCT